MCQLLLANGSDLEERQTGTMGTALHWAADGGHQSILDLLLSHNADVNSNDRRGSTPLHHASQDGTLAFVVALLQAGADPLLPAIEGFLPPKANADVCVPPPANSCLEVVKLFNSVQLDPL